MIRLVLVTLTLSYFLQLRIIILRTAILVFVPRLIASDLSESTSMTNVDNPSYDTRAPEQFGQ
jgi:hypothetical protein